MNYVNRLTNVPEEDLSGWHKARLKFIARFVGALMKLTTVNFSKLALALNPHAKDASSYRRIQRFTANYVFDFEAFGRLLVRRVPRQTGFYGQYRPDALEVRSQRTLR